MYDTLSLADRRVSTAQSIVFAPNTFAPGVFDVSLTVSKGVRVATTVQRVNASTGYFPVVETKVRCVVCEY